MRLVCLISLLLLLMPARAAGQPEADEPGMAPPAPASQPTPATLPVLRPAAAAGRATAPIPQASWYYAVHGLKAGPLTAKQLRDMQRTGLLPRDALVWRPGFEAWRPLYAVPELVIGSRVTASRGRRPMRGLIIGGTITFGITWGLALAGSLVLAGEDCSDCGNVAAVLWIPVVGPVLTHAVDDADGSTPVTGVLVLWTLAQATGAALLIGGIVGRKPKADAVSALDLRVTPLVGAVNGIGLGGHW